MTNPNTNMPNDAEIEEAIKFYKEEYHGAGSPKIKVLVDLAQSYLSGELIPKAGLPTEEEIYQILTIVANRLWESGKDMTAYTMMNEYAKAIHTRLEGGG